MRTYFVHDDDEATCRLVCLILAKSGPPDDPRPRVSGTWGPCAAEKILFLPPPDAMIIDIMLRDEPSGVEFAQVIRPVLAEWAEMAGVEVATRLIGYSASDQECERAADSGLFDAVVAKPFDIEALLVAVAPPAARVPAGGVSCGE